jgi:hypothetical protein
MQKTGYRAQMIQKGADGMNEPNGGSKAVPGFFATLLQGILRDLMRFVMAFALGTAGGAAICLYYGIPLILSLIGGVALLGLFLALTVMS